MANFQVHVNLLLQLMQNFYELLIYLLQQLSLTTPTSVYNQIIYGLQSCDLVLTSPMEIVLWEVVSLLNIKNES